MGAAHRIVLPVEWGDTDAAGIVFYPNYYRWFDRAAHALLRPQRLAAPGTRDTAHRGICAIPEASGIRRRGGD
jgi:acyl-CoA thioesterase FadM